MKRFRIYTEDKNREKIEELLSIAFDSFTVIRTKGFWKGTPENAIIIEIFTKDAQLVKALCGAIKRSNKQEAVGLTVEEVDFQLI